MEGSRQVNFRANAVDQQRLEELKDRMMKPDLGKERAPAQRRPTSADILRWALRTMHSQYAAREAVERDNARRAAALRERLEAELKGPDLQSLLNATQDKTGRELALELSAEPREDQILLHAGGVTYFEELDGRLRARRDPGSGEGHHHVAELEENGRWKWSYYSTRREQWSELPRAVAFMVDRGSTES